MHINDLKKATEHLRTYERAKEIATALDNQSVVGVMLLPEGQQIGQGHATILQKGQHSGTGSLSSISWSDSLQSKMTKALKEWAAEQVCASMAALDRLGVEVK